MNKLIKILSVFFMVVVIATNVYAADINDIDDILNHNGGITEVDTAARRIWATVVTIVQILSVAAFAFAGIRYMFASADQKADLKRGLGFLALGAVLVFASTTVISFVTGIAKTTLK